MLDHDQYLMGKGNPAKVSAHRSQAEREPERLIKDGHYHGDTRRGGHAGEMCGENAAMSILKDRCISGGILTLAALLRLLFLGIKPPHFDEGVNGWFVDQITRNGFYHYDPTNYHGPLHFYILFLAQTLLGRHIWALRLPLALISVGTVYLTLQFTRFIGKRAATIAALAMTVSPAAVFYSRYAIHEPCLVLSLLLIVWGMAGLWKFGTIGYLWALSLGITAGVLTKETYILHYVCFGLAGASVWILEKVSPCVDPEPMAKQTWSRYDLSLCIAASVLLILFFYSGTLMDWQSLKGLYQTFGAWFETGRQGHGHEKQWDYWLTLFCRYEWPALIGLAGAIFSVSPAHSRLVRFSAIYSVATLAAYSLIHYKTPWCIISLIWPFFLIFGVLAAKISERFPLITFVRCSALLLVSLIYCVWLNFFHYVDEHEPYVYVQTFKDVDKLMSPLRRLIAVDPTTYHLNGAIILSSYHPLPWLLGEFTDVGYYDDGKTPDVPDADFLVVEQSRTEEIEKNLKDDYFTDSMQLRSSQEPSKLYLSTKKFGSLYPGRHADFCHGGSGVTTHP